MSIWVYIKMLVILRDTLTYTSVCIWVSVRVTVSCISRWRSCVQGSPQAKDTEFHFYFSPSLLQSLPPRSLKGHTVLWLRPLLPLLIPSLSIQDLLKESALGIKIQFFIRTTDVQTTLKQWSFQNWLEGGLPERLVD